MVEALKGQSYFESSDGLDIGKESLGAERLEEQAQGARLQRASMLGKGLCVEAPVVKF
jgi:hypothetical protein